MKPKSHLYVCTRMGILPKELIHQPIHFKLSLPDRPNKSEFVRIFLTIPGHKIAWHGSPNFMRKNRTSPAESSYEFPKKVYIFGNFFQNFLRRYDIILMKLRKSLPLRTKEIVSLNFFLILILWFMYFLRLFFPLVIRFWKKIGFYPDFAQNFRPGSVSGSVLIKNPASLY